MNRQLLKISSVLFVVILFALMTGFALAEKKRWFVAKDKDGTCRVIEAETIAGPFKTIEEAEKRKAKDCAKGGGQATEQLRRQQEQGEHMRSQREQAEPMRRQHQQREEPQQQQLRKQQAPQQQETEKLKGKAQEKTEGAKAPEEKVKEKTKEPIPSDKKN